MVLVKVNEKCFAWANIVINFHRFEHVHFFLHKPFWTSALEALSSILPYILSKRENLWTLCHDDNKLIHCACPTLEPVNVCVVILCGCEGVVHTNFLYIHIHCLLYICLYMFHNNSMREMHPFYTWTTHPHDPHSCYTSVILWSSSR